MLLGLGATAAAFGPLSDRLGRAPAHVRIDWPAVAGAFALAVVVSGFAAAWAARRVLAAPVLDGLRDRDVAAPRAGRSARTLAAALTAATAAALGIAAFARVPLLGALGLLGLLASAAVLLSWRLPAERPAPRPVALRLAVRDIERNGRRSAACWSRWPAWSRWRSPSSAYSVASRPARPTCTGLPCRPMPY